MRFPIVAVAVLLAVLPPGGTFIDDDGDTHEGGIEAIAAAGITLGCNPPANDRFCPEDTVTRGQMAAFLARARDLPDTTADFFTDDDGHRSGLRPAGQRPVLPGPGNDPGPDGDDARQSL
jgi:hypothetical protein